MEGQRISADPHKNKLMPSILLTEASKVCNLGGFCGVYGTRTRDPMRDRHVF